MVLTGVHGCGCKRLCSVHDDLLALHALPLYEGSAQDGERGCGNGDVEGLGQCQVVGCEHTLQVLRFDLVLEFSGSNREDNLSVKLRNEGSEVFDELVREDVLADTDEERTTECLGEHHNSSTNRDVVRRECSLNSDKSLLHTEADTSTEEELIADPSGRVRVGLKGREHTGADGHEDTGDEHEWGVVAKNGNEDTGAHRDDDQTQYAGQVHDTRLGCRDTLDGLEPDRQEVYHDEETSTKHSTEPCGSPHVTVEEDAGRDCSVFLLIPLDGDKADNEKGEDDKEGDDAAVTPGVLGPTPLQRKEQANDGWEEECCTFKIELLQLLLPCGLDLLSTTLDVKERDDERSSEGSERQINVETPSPGEVIGEGSTHAKLC
jgi:hypothetical protein